MASADDNTIILTFKYRLLPNRKQHAALTATLEGQRQLYNAALEHRIGAYRKAGQRISLYTQMAELTELRREPEFAAIPLNIQRWTLRRLDDSYQAFFRRVKIKGERAGFPRFRGTGGWKSFGFAELPGIQLNGKRVSFKGIPGGLRLHLHRPLPDGKPRCCTFTRDVKGWYVCLQYRMPVEHLPPTGRKIGLDLGLTHLATLSTGDTVPNPRVAKRAEREMRRRQRALARCKLGSRRRAKMRTAVTRCYVKIRNSRNTYLHQVSARLVYENDLIVVENLNVKGLAAGMLAKSVHDAAWSKFKKMLAYKAEWAGRQLVEVDCRKTSQTCPECGQVVKKPLKQRIHQCDCGCVLDRDHAAALVILQRGRNGSRVSQREAVACA